MAANDPRATQTSLTPGTFGYRPSQPPNQIGQFPDPGPSRRITPPPPTNEQSADIDATGAASATIDGIQTLFGLLVATANATATTVGTLERPATVTATAVGTATITEGAGSPAISVVSSAVGNSGSTAVTGSTITGPAAPATSAVLIVGRSGGMATGALSDVTGGGTWALATRGSVSGAQHTRVEIWYCENYTPGNNVIWSSGNSQTSGWLILGIQGQVTSSSLDTASPDNSGQASGSTVITTPTITTGQYDLIIAATQHGGASGIGVRNPFTALPSWTENTSNGGDAGYLIGDAMSVAAIFDQAGTNNAGTAIAGFRAAPASGGPFVTHPATINADAVASVSVIGTGGGQAATVDATGTASVVVGYSRTAVGTLSATASATVAITVLWTRVGSLAASAVGTAAITGALVIQSAALTVAVASATVAGLVTTSPTVAGTAVASVAVGATRTTFGTLNASVTTSTSLAGIWTQVGAESASAAATAAAMGTWTQVATLPATGSATLTVSSGSVGSFAATAAGSVALAASATRLATFAATAVALATVGAIRSVLLTFSATAVGTGTVSATRAQPSAFSGTATAGAALTGIAFSIYLGTFSATASTSVQIVLFVKFDHVSVTAVLALGSESTAILRDNGQTTGSIPASTGYAAAMPPTGYAATVQQT